MKTILEKNEMIGKVISAQKVNENCKYKLSKFCRYLEVDSNKIVYNNLTKALVELSNEEDEFFAKLPMAFCAEMKELVENWILVPTDFNEHSFCDSVFNIVDALTKKNAITTYTIFTTTACNARCSYCFEEGAKKESMSPFVAEKVAEYIIENSKKNHVTLSWFGGEPLCNSKAIDIICNKLKENNIKYSSRFTSNAYLFNEETVKKAVDLWNTTSVQITLDGTEEIYNKIKNYVYKTGGSPFKIVIFNINNLLSNNINVSVRLNITDDNYNDLFDLVDVLDCSIIKDKGIFSVYAASLYDLNGTDSLKYKEFKNQQRKALHNYIFSKGLRPNYQNFNVRLGTIIRGCMAQSSSAAQISPNGDLARCEHFFAKEDSYGNIFDGVTNAERYNYWNEIKRLPDCYECPLYPVCLGITHCPNQNHKCDAEDRAIKIFGNDEYIKQAYNKLKKEV